MPKEAKILSLVGILVVVAAIALIAFRPETKEASAPVDGTVLIREGSHMTGTATSKVQIVEFGDYQCPACGAAAPITEKLMADYAGNPDVSFVFRHFPLPQHKNALISAQAAEAAAEQGKFWEMHNMLYAKQNDWSELAKPIDTFVGYATTLGLDVETFKKNVTSYKYAAIINADKEDALTLGVNSTPTFYLNGVQFGSGVPDYTQLKAAIDGLLK